MSSRDQFVGLGAQLYRVERPWGKLPAGLSYAGIADVTAMSSGRVAVLFRGDPAVLVFESDGSLADRWSMPDVVAGHYIRACASGRIFLSDFDGHRIFILSEDGRSERVLGARDRPRFCAPFNHPADAVEAPDGEIFVADGYGNSCVHRFTADGTLVATWGRPGCGKLWSSVRLTPLLSTVPGVCSSATARTIACKSLIAPGGGSVKSGGCSSLWRSSRRRMAAC